MKPPTRAAVLVCLAAAVACSAASRHKALTTFFDGVPPLKTAPASAAPSPASHAAAQKASYTEHGPYAAKNCDACHLASAMNALVAPKDQLCGRCHEVSLDVTYVHGPLASGGCLVCHDPHRSRYAALLVADAATFCVRCHDRGALEAVPGHDDPQADCTACHDAHGSAQKYLLR